VALSYEDAERVGLKPKNLTFDVGVSTANGIAKAARVLLREVEIDNVRVDDVEGLVLPKGAMRGTLLGMSFLSRLKSFSVEDGRLILKN
jgi:aspartyl protease family protein